MITPEKAREMRAAGWEQIRSSLEEKIDKALISEKSRYVSIALSDEPMELVNTVVAAYVKIGWKMTIQHGDQREPGTWIQVQL